ncbi:DUF4142 domain-containing protein [Lentzea tibetensis]|uniref:DUF4142 domain-containing protein n=1 Tax=Lentzea tibetensis TaxID=2591470 RepID=A0A563F302_9PSEU|nr:DUF4142 domain-containing protein [Lentzea tibetensis]TWP54299.1 DUF4142 domain-containing protein [Lentzea tibetensis]
MFTRTAGAVLALVLLLSPVAAAQPGLGPDFTPTAFGPMGPAGRDMLVKVRLAGLWEGPAGRLGLEKSANPLVKDAGRHLIEGHTELDAKVLELGRTLNVELPTEANADQQGWIGEMTAAPARSVEFDRVFANRLRAAHGSVYKFLAEVRTGTRNTLIRDFAKRCMEVVLDHITVIEATGMVDFSDTTAIPVAKLAASSNAAKQQQAQQLPPQFPAPGQTGQAGQRSDATGWLPGVLVIIAVAAGVVFWSGGGRRTGKRRV